MDYETLQTRVRGGLNRLTAPDYVTGVKTLGAILWLLPILALSPLVRALPASWRLYRRLHRWSAWQMQKAASADALTLTRRSNGKLDTLPAKWVEGAEDEKDRTGWRIKTLGEKRFDPAVHGNETARFGKADMVPVSEDTTELGTWAEATMDNAFQLDRERYLFRDAKVTIEQLVYDVQDPAAGAMADGGTADPTQQIRTQDVSLSKPGVLEDVLVPVTSRSGYDGQVVSFDQYSNLKSEQSDQETIRDAKNQAWAAAKLDDIERADMLKWLIAIGVWSFILLFHQDIGAFIAGLSGSGTVGNAASAAGGLG